MRGDLPFNSVAQIHTSVALLTSRDLTRRHASHISVVAHISWDVTAWPTCRLLFGRQSFAEKHTVYVGSYTETGTTGMLCPPTAWRQKLIWDNVTWRYVCVPPHMTWAHVTWRLRLKFHSDHEPSCSVFIHFLQVIEFVECTAVFTIQFVICTIPDEATFNTYAEFGKKIYWICKHNSWTQRKSVRP